MYEESIQNTIPKENIQFKKVSFKEIKSNRQAFKKLGEARIKKNPSLQYRGVYNEDYGVFIDTTNIVKLEKDGKHSFTFRITNQDVLNKIENLVLNSKDDGSYEAFITEYLLSPQEMIVLENKLPLNDKEPTSITKVENLAKINITGDGSDCIGIQIITTSYCKNSLGVVVENTGSLQDDCREGYFTEDSMILTINADCLSAGGGNTNSAGNNPGSGDPDNWSGIGGDGNTNPDTSLITGQNPILTSPILDFNIVEEKIRIFLSVDSALQAWWGNSNNDYLKSIIKGFFAPSGSFTTENITFTKQFILQTILNPYLPLDFIASSKSPSNIDRSSIDTSTPTGAKFDLVYEELMNSPKFKELFIDLFDNNDRFNVKFQIGDVPNGANGNTETDTDLVNPSLNTITISTQYLLNKNKMEIAKTIIHECIHAFLNVKLLDPSQGMSIPNLNNMEFCDVVNLEYNNLTADQNQHNFIYNYMIPTMVTILSEVKDLLVSTADNNNIEALSMHIPYNNSPSTPFVWADYYHNLSLNGLQNCSFFQNEIGTFDNQGNILTIINQALMQAYNLYNLYGSLYLH